MAKHLDFSAALRSFMGYLEGTQKADHTISNYRLDVLSFQKFLASELPSGTSIRLETLNTADVNRFHAHLRGLGLKTNTRRRKLLTVHRFLGFLAQRNKLPPELGKKIPTPHKIERVPFAISSNRLIDAIRSLPDGTILESRNRVLLWVMAETGCLVSEVTRLRYDGWKLLSSDVAELQIEGKARRTVKVSPELFAAVQELREKKDSRPASTRRADEDSWLFLGFNKFGSMGKPITARGIELLVKQLGPRLWPRLGNDDSEADDQVLTPRTFRHSAVIRWFQEGLTRDEIQSRLGLKTPYAFKSYEPLLKGLAYRSNPGRAPHPLLK